MRLNSPAGIVLVFGATGRLGSTTVEALHRTGVTVARLARGTTATASPPDLTVDVTDQTGAELRALRGLTEGHAHVTLLDAVLDRASVTTMRASLGGAAALVSAVAADLQHRGHAVRVVSASTTAVLAPALYQTPYGRAKRWQLAHYATVRVPRRAVLLPVLCHHNSPDQAGDINSVSWLTPLTNLARITWSYERAATALAEACVGTGSNGFELVVPSDRPIIPTDVFPMRRRVVAALAVVPVTIASLTVSRSSPHARRLASRGRLYITPTPLRRRIDHHLAPPGRVTSLARRLDASVIWTQT